MIAVFNVLVMQLLLSSTRFARGWTFNPSTLRHPRVPNPSSATTLRSYSAFRWSNEEFKPQNATKSLSATSRAYNNDTSELLTEFDINEQRDLISLKPDSSNGSANTNTCTIGGFSPTTQTASSNLTYPGEVESLEKVKLGPNQNVPMPPLDQEEIIGVLGVNPKDIDVVHRNQTMFQEKPPVMTVNEMFRNSHFVEMFRGSANYIANHRNSLVVYHIPGDWIDHDDPKVLRDLMNDISLTWLLGLKIVIVVGCRYQVEKRLGESRRKHMGMVVTDPESLKIVKKEAGYVRFEVERQLARSLQGSRGAKGLDGNVVSGNFFSAQPFGVLDGVDYQYSGFVRRFEADKIHQYHANKDIVLLTTLGVSPTGEVFNVNSEYLAAYAGGALGANKVVYFLEEDIMLQHRVHGTRVPHLRVSDARKLLKENHITTEKKGFVYVGKKSMLDESATNMLTKFGWSMHALEKGVKRVHIVHPENGALLQELYTRDGAGTLISGDLYDGIHQAKITDVNGIHDLISPLIKQGTLINRPKAVLEKDIHQYHVYTRDDLIVACGQLKMFENGYAEIGCLVVSPAYRARGRGDAMLGYLERLCVHRGASVVFVLSTQTMEWFIERGFDEVPVEMLPPSRQATYNKVRASKIYMKKIDSVRDLDASELFWNK